MNSYVLVCPATRQGVLIDPGAEPEMLLVMLADTEPIGILLTHTHPDHMGALEEMRTRLRVSVMAHPGPHFEGMRLDVDRTLEVVDGFVEPALLAQQQPEPIVHVGVARMGFGRLAMSFDLAFDQAVHPFFGRSGDLRLRCRAQVAVGFLLNAALELQPGQLGVQEGAVWLDAGGQVDAGEGFGFQTGFELGDAQDLARQLKRLVEEPDLVRTYSENTGNVRTVEDNVDEVLELYERLLR